MTLHRHRGIEARTLPLLLALCILCCGSFGRPGWAAPGESAPDAAAILAQIVSERPSKSISETSRQRGSDPDESLLQEKNAEYRLLQEKHRMTLLLVILASTPLLLGIVLFCLKNSPQCSEESLVSAIGLVLVIEGTMFVAVSAATTEQLTAPIGILGAIAGYLFGAAKRRAGEKT